MALGPFSHSHPFLSNLHHQTLHSHSPFLRLHYFLTNLHLHHLHPNQQQLQHNSFIKEKQNHPLQDLNSLEKTCLSLIKSCTKKTHLLQIHAHLIRTSLFQNPNILLSFLSTATQDLNYSRQFFIQIPKPNVFLYNTMIKVYSQSNSPDMALCFYRHMLRLGVRPNPFSSSFVIKSCTRSSSLVGGKQIHARIVQDGHQFDCLLLTSLMGFYVSCGNGDDARQVFDEMPQPDTVAWNVLISCYTRNGRTRDALGLFDVMQGTPYGSKPDNVTCLLLLQACANLGTLDFGERIHNYIVEHGYGNALNLCNSLIAMYSKCGCLDKAYQVFNEMPDRNVVSWSAMISGLAMNGHGREAIEAFGEMQRTGIAPDDQTFTGILSACSHGGLVDEGMRFFDLMSTEFGIMPNVHHYGCVVDLLGRAGLLDQAYHLITSMMTKPDSTIWRTLLGACRIHGYVELGEHVVGHLIELKAQQAGDYVLLLNIYASVGNWEKVAVVRRMMKDKGIQTTPGCSTIELKGEVHEFVADDDLHPRKEEIYEMLDEIGGQLKIVGYVAEVAAEMHNMDMEQKEHALSYHSEKLAIAFGLVATPPGTPIRISKNLRICVDCHTFAKVLSGVYNRKIVIRDRSRFHHFREGSCSCQDYW
ncbi:pentatricopeptide repeat-containing protein At3g47530-like [Tasmannia lanceolata]|uniref:pentatricopeptide repeat-containing protein At3g47530-like n=1 Tax=Tasmannia lanceolata TaxID=3420 RepID=UPI0040648912